MDPTIIFALFIALVFGIAVGFIAYAQILKVRLRINEAMVDIEKERSARETSLHLHLENQLDRSMIAFQTMLEQMRSLTVVGGKPLHTVEKELDLALKQVEHERMSRAEAAASYQAALERGQVPPGGFPQGKRSA